MAAGLLVAAWALLVLGGVARAQIVTNGGKLNGGGCTRCDLGNMVTDCPLDVEFMLDMSDSVSRQDYRLAQQYIARQMRAVTQTFQGAAVGFLAFSNRVYSDIPIQSRSDLQLQQLMNQVQSLQQQRHGTNLADALRRAHQKLTSHGGSTLVPSGRRGKVIVLVSDGCPDNDQEVMRAGVQARQDNVAIVSVQVGGDGMYLGLLKNISRHVQDIRTNIDWSILVACPSIFLPPVTDSVCSDFVIAMDGSDSVRRWERVMRHYLAYTAMRFSDVNNAMGVIVFGTDVNTQSTATMIRPSRNKRSVAQQAENTLSFPSQRGTGTTQAILRARQDLRQLSGDRTLVVITDGPALNPQNARRALADASADGLQVVVIGVGEALSPAELQTMAGPGSVIRRVDSYLDLFSLDFAQILDCRPTTDNRDICPSRHQCNNLQVWSNVTCDCECRERCRDPNEIQNRHTCVCCEPVTCTPPFVPCDTNNCSCVCPVTQCGPEEKLNPHTCICERIQCQNPPSCRGNFRFDPKSCQCVCPVTQCAYGQQLNPYTCICERAGCDINCNGNFRLNVTTCQCVCPETPCNYGEQLNRDTCVCEWNPCQNPPSCSGNFRLNPNTCRCEQNPCQNPPICRGNFRLDTSTCRCVCPVTQCNYGEQLNRDTCVCEQNQCRNPPSCGGNFRLDPNTCRCVCRIQCDDYRERLNPNSCTCEPRCSTNTMNMNCQGNKRFNWDSCRCEPRCSTNTMNMNCQGNKRFNWDSCRCECPPSFSCPQNLEINRSTCQCGGKDLSCAIPPRCTGLFQPNNITCRCECPSSSDAWCRQFGQSLNQRTCTCEYVPPTTLPPVTSPVTPRPGDRRKCPPSLYRCQNNQPAWLDCQDRCICHCDSRFFAGFYCDLPVRPSLCDHCFNINGNYLAGVEGRCDLFVVCTRDGRGGFLPHIRDCAPGTIFDRKTGQCNHISLASCPTDPCRNLPPLAKYPSSRSCGRYWQCDANGKTASAACCPAGQGFSTSQGNCVPDSNCPNECAPDFQSCHVQGNEGGGRPTCPYRMDVSNRRRFVNPAAPRLYQYCSSSDYFNETLCRCVLDITTGCSPTYDYDFENLDQITDGFKGVEIRPGSSVGSSGDVAYFGGNARIILYQFSNSGYHTNYFEISVRVRPGNVNLRPGEQMVIVSNGDCGGEETLAITVDRQRVYFKVKAEGSGRVTVLEVPYTIDASGWINVKFQYERQGSSSNYLMTGTVNGQSKSVTIFGVIGHTRCALQVGHGQGTTSLTGYVDDFKVWKCKPNSSGTNTSNRRSNSSMGTNTNNAGWNRWGTNTQG